MKPEHNQSAVSQSALAACAVGASTHAERGEAQQAASAACAARSAGAPPSITAPAKCILSHRHGVDSLYLSFPGTIDPRMAIELQQCKLLAQATNDRIVAQAGIDVDDHRLTVLPRGRGRFAFVMEDNWFSIQLSNASAGMLPLAMVQVRSEYLTAVGPEEAIATTSQLVESLGTVTGPAKISRIDLFADFSTSLDLAKLPGSHWVKRSKKRSIHEECDQVTGISFGSGNEVSARLYDKTREIQKSGKDYLKPLWAEQGWDGVGEVWRMEFQIRREGLPEAMLCPAQEALLLCGNLWRYLCEEWLRLAVPSESDDTRSRWDTHPFWEGMARVWDADPDAPPLTRVPKSRLPTDDYLFRTGLAGLTSFMAREGIGDFGHGLGGYLNALETYFGDPMRRFPEGLEDYIRRKTRAKARRYNVRIPDYERE